MRALCCLSLVLAVWWLAGCARQQAPRVSASGVSFVLPSGWEEREPGSALFAHPREEETWVMVMSNPRAGKTLSAFVDEAVGEQQALDRVAGGLVGTAGWMAEGAEQAPAPPAGTTVVSRRDRQVGGRQGIEVVLEAEARVLTLFVPRGDQAVEISCRSPKQDFARHEPAFRQVLASVRVE